MLAPLLFSAAALPLLARAGGSKPVEVRFPERASAAARMNVVQDNFLGISHELSSFGILWGNDTTLVPRPMLNYLSNVRARMTQPLRVRVGGNGMDNSTYAPDMADTMLRHPPQGNVGNEIPVTFGPVFFDVMNKVADAVGEMQFIVGLSARDAANMPNVLELTRAAEAKLGPRLDALLLGNEPDLYGPHAVRPTYEISDYVDEMRTMVSALENGTHASLPLGGPTVCCYWDLDSVLSAGLADIPHKYYTLQHYPQNACQGDNARNGNASYFATHANLRAWGDDWQRGVNMGRAAGVPVLMTEYNTVSCGGGNISDTFLSALWATDAGLRFAAHNISGAYLHTREQGIKYNLFDPPSEEASYEEGWTTGPVYYALLAVAEALEAGGSVVVDLNLNGSTTNQGATVAAYGVYDAAGSRRAKAVLINYAETEQSFELSANVSGGNDVLVRYMSSTGAGALLDRAPLAWAGQTVDGAGRLGGEQRTERVGCADGCAVQVPGPGLALLVLDPDGAGIDALFSGDAAINSVVDDGKDKDDENAGSRGYPSAAALALGTLLTMVVAASMA